MPQIAVRVSEEELALLDRLVAEEHFTSRAAVIRDALARLRKERDDREMVEELRRAYERVPVTQEEIDLGITGALIMAETTKDEPPWDFDDEDDADPLRRVETAASELLQLVHEARGRAAGGE